MAHLMAHLIAQTLAQIFCPLLRFEPFLHLFQNSQCFLAKISAMMQ